MGGNVERDVSAGPMKVRVFDLEEGGKKSWSAGTTVELADTPSSGFSGLREAKPVLCWLAERHGTRPRIC